MRKHITTLLLVLLCLTPISTRFWIQETYGAECEDSCSDPVQLARMSPAILGASSESVITQLFYSDFEDAADDAQWSSLPAGWSDDYTTDPLEGSESATSDGGGSDNLIHIFGSQSTGTTYARVAFKKKGNGSSLTTGFAIGVADATPKFYALCDLRYNNSTNLFYRIYAYDSTVNSYAVPTAVEFNDSKYYFVMTYTRGASVKCEVTDSIGNVVTGWSVERTTAESGDVDRFYVRGGGAGVSVAFDEAEVRTNANWGTSP